MKKAGIGGFLLLQITFLIYSGSSVVAKFASGNEVMSFKFILFYGLEVMILGVYAILWQQAIKKYELSVAYANKAVTLLWALLWSVIIFKETLKPTQVIGVLTVIVGIIVLNLDLSKKKEETVPAEEAALEEMEGSENV
ncbi:MAG: EamA family transporter [Lachnospiraceae bacterium]|nr:EamA family transporter [Lachnospiraceae bacterium]